MEQIAAEHVERLKTAVLKRFTAERVAAWITQKTFIAGQPYSFDDHEYQERIVSDMSEEVNTRKCSQVGVSEATARMSLGLVSTISPYTLAYTLPTASFAEKFAKTRVDPVIENSPTLKHQLHSAMNSAEVKQFGDSFLWMRGAASSNAPISIPCDHLVHDELDFSDLEVIAQYHSRLTHSKWGRKHRFSTPTLPDFGIDREFQKSRRHFLFAKCSHCGHQFIPDYYRHVRIPDYDDDLRRITAHTLAKIRYEEAALHCPRCDRVPDLSPKYREWVCENPGEKLIAAGYQVSPFDAPNIITPKKLVVASVSFKRHQDFDNFSLGLPSADREATFSDDDFIDKFVDQPDSLSAVKVMGVDTGSTYHFKIGIVDPYDNLYVVESHKVPVRDARQFYREMRAKHRLVCTVMDSGPHAETVIALQQEDPNLFASVYTRSRSILTHTVVDREEDKDLAKQFVRQVNVNRNRALDAYMEYVRAGHMTWKDCQLKQEIIKHHCSMKRVQNFDHESGEMIYAWQKTDGEDHFHHTGLYLYIAAKIRGVGRPAAVLPLARVRRIKTSGKPKE